MIVLKSTFVRALIYQLAGSVAGILLAMGIRLAVGLPAWKEEPVIVVGALVGAVAFMVGTGILDDWLKWFKGEHTAEVEDMPDPFGKTVIVASFKRLLNVSYDHKVIGLQYGMTSLLMFTIAGLFALVFRTELARPGIQFLVPDWFNTFMTLHGILHIYGILLGVAAMSNFLVPLLIGANDMAFPRLNAFAYWLNVPSAVLLMTTLVLGGVDAGWTGYPPLSANLGKVGFSMFFLGVYLFGLSSILGGLNIIATIVRLRAPGMTPFKMPIFVWAALATSIISLTATQLIGLAFQMVLFERLFGMDFFNPSAGGNVLLFQHLFWFYSHPAVYVFVLTGLGVISELLPVFARKPLFGYKAVAMSSMGIALVGMLVWAHHMFASGMEPYLRVPFTFTTLLVAVPTGVKFFSWIATIWGGKMTFETPMLFVLGGISIFLLGGLSGPPNATVATDLHLTDTYFIVGHFHATMFGGYVFPFIAAHYYWFPKITGRKYSERLGKLHFWMMLLGFYVQSLGQMDVGLLGMRRRIADYDPALGITVQQTMITIAAFAIGLSMLIFFVNMLYHTSRGEVAERNPWRSRSPEWELPSPLVGHNYDRPIQVLGEPYDYGLEGSIYTSPGAPAASPAGAD